MHAEVLYSMTKCCIFNKLYTPLVRTQDQDPARFNQLGLTIQVPTIHGVIRVRVAGVKCCMAADFG